MNATTTPAIIPINRITNPSVIDKQLLDERLKTGNTITIQFDSEIYNDSLLSEINELCNQYKENLCIRFYAHNQTGFDCSTILRIPDVKNLYVDCLDSARNIQAFSAMNKLVSLHIGILDLSDNEILRAENLYNLKELGINQTISKKLNLEYLANYTNLDSLYIDGHIKNIHTIGKLQHLKDLWLRSIKKVTLDFVNRMEGLEKLEITLGGRNNINEIGASNIKELFIDFVAGFNDISGIWKLKKLEKLGLSLLKQLKTIKVENINTSLKELWVYSCKDLNTFEGLDNLKALTKLDITEVSMNFEEFMQLPMPQTLQELDFATLKAQKDKEISEMIRKLGYKTLD
ncbi:MAG: hypothetical protein QM731_08630 [Chitinophagaceae bacterium]